MQHAVLTQRGAEPCQQVRMLRMTVRTGGLPISLDEVMMESTIINKIYY